MKNGYNPFDDKLADIKQRLSVAKHEQKNIESRVARYKGDLEEYPEKLSSDKVSLNRDHQNATSLENAINDQRTIVEQDKKKAPFWFDPRKLFHPELREAGRAYKKSLSKLKHLEDKRNLNSIVEKIAELEAEDQRVSHRKNKCGKLQAPVLEALRKSERELNDLGQQLSKAEQYERKLSDAHNSHERAMIHREAERELGGSSPQNIIGKCQSKKESLKRTIEKQENRLRKIADTLSIDIQTFVIDGSNLLYADGQFIGTAALLSLTQKLLEEGYKVIIIFDENFRLKQDIAKLKNHFQKSIEIREMPRGIEADQAILNAADANSTYVISNDTFRDFPEKKCVAEKRIFKHMITTGIIQIPDIDIQSSFDES